MRVTRDEPPHKLDEDVEMWVWGDEWAIVWVNLIEARSKNMPQGYGERDKICAIIRPIY